MGFYLGSLGYYEGDRASADDAEVPRRPDWTYDWDGIQWVQNAARAAPAADPITALANAGLGEIPDLSISTGHKPC